MRVGIALIIALSAVVSSVPAEPAFQQQPTKAQLRDAALHAPTGTIFLAAYDRNEVWQVNPVTQERLATIRVGAGPVALAFSADKAALACVNHLANSVSLIRVADAAVYATVACGKGACDVAGLPRGWFAVANSFADSVTVVNASQPEQVQTLGDITSVPTAVAASGSLLGVATQAPAALHVFANHGQTLVATIPLDAAPVALAPVEPRFFAVATDTGIALVDPTLPGVIARCHEHVVALASDGRHLFALNGSDSSRYLTDEVVAVMNGSLERVETLDLAAPGRVVSAGDGIVVVLSPTSNAWQVHGIFQDAPQVAMKPPGMQPKPPEPSAEKATLRPEPVEEVQPEPVVEVQAQPVEEVPPEPADTGKATPGLSPQAPGAAGFPKTTYRRIPWGGLAPRAPHPARRPSASVLQKPSKRSLIDGLTTPGYTGLLEGGFESPDWTQPLRDMEGDEWDLPIDGGAVSVRGNVRLRLDTVNFAAEQFSYDEVAGKVCARDRVRITQNNAVLTADELFYELPGADELPAAVLDAELDEQARAKRRLSLGHIDISNLHLVEPTRELKADHIEYDFLDQTGELVNVEGHAATYHFHADKLRVLGPDAIMAKGVWLSTCDRDPPHYRIRLKEVEVRDGRLTKGKHAWLQLGRVSTPIYWPVWRFRGEGQSLDLESGHRAALGYYINYGQHFPVTRDVTLGLRLFPTTQEGVGFGLESEYDFMESPASPLFRSKGAIRTLHTTERRGYAELYHRHEVTEDAVLLVQAEQWRDRDFYKDFYYERYHKRTEPRTFANLTLTRPKYIATGTVRKNTHDFVRETERLPEVTYHRLEHRLAENLYFTFDTINGYNEREPDGLHAVRLTNVGRLTADLDLDDALSVTPFLELEGTWYSDERNSNATRFRYSNTVGTTLQTRFHKAYAGKAGFSGFKHIIVPSVSYSYRPEPTVYVDRIMRFDAADNVYGRSRVESKIDSVLFGRDAETQEVWQVGRLTLYQGNDFWNEKRKSDDYEIEFDVRPRPWWGMQLFGERHLTSDDYDLDEPFFVERNLLKLYERATGKPWDLDTAYRYDAQYSDYDRVLSFLYYDDMQLDGSTNARLGFAYTKTRHRIFNREVLYGAGYKLGDKWGVSFEHRYDLERDNLARQEYQLRRRLHCWDMALTFVDRESGWDVGVEFTIVGFPGTKVKF